MDLNWANPEVKKAVFRMLDFWVGKGIDGFRLDVINNLTLTDCMTDKPYDEEKKQIHKYDVNQPGIHDFMRELKKYLSRDRELFLVGGGSSDDLDVIHSFNSDGQLDTTFNFNLGSMDQFVFPRFYGELEKMMKLYCGDNYPTIFFGSHDMTRFPSRFHFNDRQVKNIFTLMMSCRAIPFIYFGDEIGMKNYECRSIDDARDIQGVIAYRQAKAAGKSESEAIQILNKESRDHSRNTMYWDDSAYGGFSTAVPWINYQKQPGKSAAEQIKEKDSVFSHVSALAHERSQDRTLAEGDWEVRSPEEGVIICTRRCDADEVLSVINFSEKTFELTVDRQNIQKAEIMIKSEPDAVLEKENKLLINAESSAMWRFEK